MNTILVKFLDYSTRMVSNGAKIHRTRHRTEGDMYFGGPLGHLLDGNDPAFSPYTSLKVQCIPGTLPKKCLQGRFGSNCLRFLLPQARARDT